MDTVVYEKEYPLTDDDIIPDAATVAKTECLLRELKARNDAVFAVDTRTKKLYSDVLERRDAITRAFSGRARGLLIDYYNHTARAEMECPYAEFKTGEFMSALAIAVICADSIEFTPTASGLLNIRIKLPYFKYLGETPDV